MGYVVHKGDLFGLWFIIYRASRCYQSFDWKLYSQKLWCVANFIDSTYLVSVSLSFISIRVHLADCMFLHAHVSTMMIFSMIHHHIEHLWTSTKKSLKNPQKHKIDLNIAKCGWIFMLTQTQQSNFEEIFTLGKHFGPPISSYTSYITSGQKVWSKLVVSTTEKRIHDPNVEERKINMRFEIFQSNI